MKKGDVWMVDLPEGKGHEQQGYRPAIVMGTTEMVSAVVPLTTTRETTRFPYTHPIQPDSKNGLHVLSVALVFQVASLDPERFSRKIGELSREDLEAIDALAKVFFDLK